MLDSHAKVKINEKETTPASEHGAMKETSATRARVSTKKGLTIPRIFSQADVNPFDTVEWERRTASISDEKGRVVFEQRDVEIPKAWSMLATNVVASKYFYGEMGTPEREYSVRQLVHRVVRTMADWGLRDGYFATEEDAAIFYDELAMLCLHQYGAFNSPVWFNCGLFHLYGVGKDSGGGAFYYDPQSNSIQRASTQYEYPQCSACFIQSVEDTMEGIMDLARSEAMLFKYGSGTGTDLSTIRSSKEKLSGGGHPSGPLSFLKVYDSIASVVKSGGKTRRAAKMNTLKDWHPDIKEFIQAKSNEEKKAWALIEAGYDGDFNGEAYASVCFQNENLSVRVTDAFMQAAINDEEWQTRYVTQPSVPGPTYKARDLLKWIAEGTWICGDPGVQFEDTIQRWHTCKESGPINSSNPCSEYMFLDDTACNLASLNLMKFIDSEGQFDVHRFKSAVDIFIIAQEIEVDNASYPTELIAQRSHEYRTLGLGYANLGSMLMACGLAYDSDEGRGIAGAITAIMHLEAYSQSARLASLRGSFEGYAPNRERMDQVVEMHRAAIQNIQETAPEYLVQAARECGDEAVDLGKRFGYRNAQVTVLAPTGTIGFMMDCDTTGVEPDIALVKYKLLAGGGLLKIVNGTVGQALNRLGYTAEQVDVIIAFIDKNDTIEGAPDLAPQHLPVFDCAFKPLNGERYIPYLAHIRMMAAVQPFLSGAISKTVNMPEKATAEEIMQTYIESWEMGLKAVAIYRDGCKRSQPVNTGKKKQAEVSSAPESETHPGSNGSKAHPLRRRLPNTRKSITHKFEIGGHEGYLTVGLYENGAPGELFITMAKEGSTIGGLMDAFGTAISICLQYGVDLKTLVRKFVHTRFEPSGFTKNPDVPIAKSLMDYIFRWLGMTFVEGYEDVTRQEDEEHDIEPVPTHQTPSTRPETIRKVDDQFSHYQEDAPICDTCGSITVRNGSCYRCFNCGNSMGCS